MFEGEDIAFSGLEVCNYRHLQQVAKSMGLPSNVKKVYLIELIRAKKFCSEDDLNAIINRIKMERKVNTQTKKKKPKRKPFRLQMTEISSTSNSHSPQPPITVTPKRPSSFVIHYSPDVHSSVVKYHPRNILRPSTSIHPMTKKTQSDRVLRSFNSIRKPNYRIMNESNCVIGVVKAQNTVQQVRQQRTYQSVNVTIHKHRPVMHPTAGNREQRMNTTVGNREHLMNTAVGNREHLMNTTVGNKDYLMNTTIGNREHQMNTTIGNKEYQMNTTIGNREHQMNTTIGNKEYQMNTTIGNKEYLMNTSVGNREHLMNTSVGNRVHPMNTTVGNREHQMNTAVENREHLMNTSVGDREQFMNTAVGNKGHLINTAVGNREQRHVMNSTFVSQKPNNRLNRIERLMQNVAVNTDRQMVPVSRTANVSPKPVKRQRKISGIYPLTQDRPYYHYVPTVGFRRQDGRVTKINAVIQKSQPSSHTNIPVAKNIRPLVVTIQDVIDQNVDNQTYNTENNVVSNTDERYIRTRNMEPNLSRNMYNAERHIQNKTAARLREQNLRMNTYNSLCYRVKEIEPISGDYQVEYQRFREEKEREYYDRPEFSRYEQEMSRNLEYSRPDPEFTEYFRHQEFARHSDIDLEYSGPREIVQSNTDYSGNDVINLRNLESSKNAYEKYPERFTPSVIDLSNQENAKTYKENTDYSRQDIELRNSATDFQDFSSQYPNMSALTDVFPEEPTDKQADFSVYYHKKIRGDQIRRKSRDLERLPHINDAFSRFSGNQIRAEPLYVHDSEKTEKVQPPMLTPSETCMLESLYNFKNQFVTNPPVLKIATTNTVSTYTTKTIVTAMAQPAADFSNNSNPYERPNLFQPQEVMPQYEYLKRVDARPTFGCDEVLSSSTMSLETGQSQELGANVTIPAIVEDALELISQDGDYMERIGMDVRVQCVLCEWAGPKIILEYHLKKDHSSEIQIQDNKDWSILVDLSSLISQQTWYSQLVQHESTVYVLSARYGDTDNLMVALSMVPSELETPKHGRITIYNKISGKPFIFEGEIKDIPDSMPYEYPLECLSVDIDSLDLIPNSANLKLVNRELVVNSPAKVVVGQELKNVEIVVYIKLLD